MYSNIHSIIGIGEAKNIDIILCAVMFIWIVDRMPNEYWSISLVPCSSCDEHL